MNRKKKIIKNIFTSLFLQIVNIIVGFIIPILIIETFGSEVNGLINSITQFLGYIVLIEAGMGGVIKSVLYKPLAQKNSQELSRVINSTENFFKKVAYIFLVYIFVLCIIYPYVSHTSLGYFNTIILLLIISLSTFVQYYFGITYQILLQADEKVYFTNLVQIITLIVNAIITFLTIKLGFNIFWVKLFGTLIFIIRPIIYCYYVKKHYNIDKSIKVDKNIIKQRWDGFAHHIAYFIHTNTDVMVLTIFGNVKEVSVYSIYLLIVNGLKQVIMSISSGVSATFGNIIANEDDTSLVKNFKIYSVVNTLITFILFTSAAILVIPFMKIYTANVSDANYIRPMFSILLIIAEGVYCLRDPFSTIIFAAGYYKDTKKGAYIEALINISLSIILVHSFGIIGVAIGTLVAMIYRFIDYVVFLQRKIIKNLHTFFLKFLFCNIIACLIIGLIVYLLPKFIVNNWIQWFICALITTIIVMLIYVFLYFIFYNKKIIKLIKSLSHQVNSK